GQANAYVGARLGVEHDGEGGGVARFGRHQSAGRIDRDAGAVVVGVGDRYIVRIDSVVVGIGAGRRSGDDLVADITIDLVVIDAGDRDCLQDVPVGGGEREAG